MSNVVPMAKFKVADQVMIQEQNFDGDELISSILVGTRVIAREYTTELGWLYRVLGRDGYLEESLLLVYDEARMVAVAESASGIEGLYSVVDPLELMKTYEQSPFKIGDYARGLRQTDADTLETQYVMIIGCLWEFGIFSYDAAILSEEGNFLEDPNGFYAEELEPVSPEEMADVIRERLIPKQRPKLTVVHSR
jgi:hypothetical protein